MKRLFYALLVAFALITLFGCNKTNATTTEKITDKTTTIHKHEIQKVQAVDSTCRKEGNIEYYKCDSCKKTFSDVNGENEIFDIIIPLKEHDYEVNETVKDTCTDDGYDILVCKACGNEKYDNFVSSVGHRFDESKTESVDATCEDPGYVLKTCAVCSEQVRTSYTESLGHIKDKVFGEIVTKPTCLEGGYTTLKCTICKKEYVTDKTDALGHEFKDENNIATVATCDYPATLERHCSRCEYQDFSVTSEALGHNFKDGICELCEKDVFQINTVIAYNKWNSLPVKVTKNEDGSCEVYSQSSISSNMNAVDDRYAIIMVRKEVLVELARRGIASIEFTLGCSDESTRAFAWQKDDDQFDAVNVGGLTYSTKSFVKKFYDGEKISGQIDQEGNMVFLVVHGRLGDDYGYLDSFALMCKYSCLNHEKDTEKTVVTEKTCIEDGYSTNVCKVCGLTYIDSIVEAEGHKYTVTESYDTATCDHIKGEIKTCSECGNVVEEIVEGKKNHSFENGTCKNCNKRIDEVSLITVTDKDSNPVSVIQTGSNYRINLVCDVKDSNYLHVDKNILDALVNDGYSYLTFAFSLVDENGRIVYINDKGEQKGFNLFGGSTPQTQASWYVVEIATGGTLKEEYANGLELGLLVINRDQGDGIGINCKVAPSKVMELVSINCNTTETKGETENTYNGGFTGYYTFAIGVTGLEGKTKVKVEIHVADQADAFQMVDSHDGTALQAGRDLEVVYNISDAYHGMIVFGFYFNHRDLPTDAVFRISFVVE